MDQLVERLRKTLLRHGLNCCIGFAERSGNAIYNSVVLLDRGGRVLLHHRKTHLWGDHERKVFAVGDSLPHVATMGEFQVRFAAVLFRRGAANTKAQERNFNLNQSEGNFASRIIFVLQAQISSLLRSSGTDLLY